MKYAPGPTEIAVLMVLGLALAGCAGDSHADGPSAPPPGPTAGEIQSAEYLRIVGELRRASECVNGIEGKPDFAPLRARAPSNPADPYPASLLDRAKASPGEGRLIGMFLDAIEPCRPTFGPFALRWHKTATRMIADTWNRQRDEYLQLKDGRTSWGVFNQNTRSTADKLTGALMALSLARE